MVGPLVALVLAEGKVAVSTQLALGFGPGGLGELTRAMDYGDVGYLIRGCCQRASPRSSDAVASAIVLGSVASGEPSPPPSLERAPVPAASVTAEIQEYIGQFRLASPRGRHLSYLRCRFRGGG